MDDAEAFLRALTWFSPAFPTGAFAYSHGLEQAVEQGLVTSAADLEDWTRAILRHGSGWSDAVLLRLTLAGEDVHDLAISLTPTTELMQETLTQGRAFALAASAAHREPQDTSVPLPIAVGRAARQAGLPAAITLQGYLHGLASHLVSAGVRLIPLGQTAGVTVLGRLETIVLETARAALTAGLDDLGASCLMVEWCSMRHETQSTRLFRS